MEQYSKLLLYPGIYAKLLVFVENKKKNGIYPRNKLLCGNNYTGTYIPT